MNFFETAMAVNLGIELSGIKHRSKPAKVDLSSIPPVFDWSIASDDFDVLSEQRRLWSMGKYDEARALQHKKAAEVFPRNK